MIAGPYRLGSSDPAVWAENLRRLNAAAYTLFQKGHTPIIGVNLALPVIDAAGEERYGQLMPALSLALADKCDGILRLEGASRGSRRGSRDLSGSRAPGVSIRRRGSGCGHENAQHIGQRWARGLESRAAYKRPCVWCRNSKTGKKAGKKGWPARVYQPRTP